MNQRFQSSSRSYGAGSSSSGRSSSSHRGDFGSSSSKFGGGIGAGPRNFSGPKRDDLNLMSLQRPNFSKMEMKSFGKDFYQESPSSSNRSQVINST